MHHPSPSITRSSRAPRDPIPLCHIIQPRGFGAGQRHFVSLPLFLSPSFCHGCLTSTLMTLEPGSGIAGSVPVGFRGPQRTCFVGVCTPNDSLRTLVQYQNCYGSLCCGVCLCVIVCRYICVWKTVEDILGGRGGRSNLGVGCFVFCFFLTSAS